jgi:hypothetical protein
MNKKIIKAILFVSCALAFSTFSYSEDWSDTISTDRPDFTESALSLPENMVQVETGFTYTRSQGENTVGAPETLIRYGINDWFEARVGTPSWGVTRRNGKTSTAFQDGYFGFKFGLEKSISDHFEVSIIPATTAPIGNAPFGENDIDAWNPEVKMPISFDLTDTFTFSTMPYLRSEALDDTGRATIYQQTFSLGVSFSDRWASFYEYVFETYSDNPFAQIAHVGITYLISPNIQADVHGGRNLSGGYGDPFIAAGISFRF